MSDRRRPVTTTLPHDMGDLLALVRKDFGSLGAFLEEAIVSYATARLDKGSKLSDAETEAAWVRARLAKKEFEIKAAQNAADLAKQRLDAVQETLAEEERRNEATRRGRKYRSPEDLIEHEWSQLPPLGPDRTKALEDLASAHGMDRGAVMRAAGKRHVAEQQRQTNLRVLPAPRKEAAR